jgi:hypothetical protein
LQKTLLKGFLKKTVPLERYNIKIQLTERLKSNKNPFFADSLTKLNYVKPR